MPILQPSKTQTITDYHAKYFAYKLTRRFISYSLKKLSSNLSNARVDLNPHQYLDDSVRYKMKLFCRKSCCKSDNSHVRERMTLAEL